MRIRIAALAGFVAALFLTPGLAAAQDTEKMGLATLEWPPYTGAELPQGGATTAVARQALEAVGMEADVAFVPWRRAIAMAQNNTNGGVAYFPATIAAMSMASSPPIRSAKVSSALPRTSRHRLSGSRSMISASASSRSAPCSVTPTPP